MWLPNKNFYKRKVRGREKMDVFLKQILCAEYSSFNEVTESFLSSGGMKEEVALLSIRK